MARTGRAFPSKPVFLRNRATDGNTRTRLSQITVIAVAAMTAAASARGARADRTSLRRVIQLRNQIVADDSGTIPITVISQAGNRSTLRRPPTDAIFVRNGQAPAAPAVKAMPLEVASITALRTARGTNRGAHVVFVRTAAAQVYVKAPPSVVETIVPLRTSRATNRGSRVVFVRNPQPPVAAVSAKAPPFVVASLASDRTSIRPRARVVFSRAALPVLRPPQPVVVSQVPERTVASRRRVTDVIFQRNPQAPIVVPPVKAAPFVVVLQATRTARIVRSASPSRHVFFDAPFIDGSVIPVVPPQVRPPRRDRNRQVVPNAVHVRFVRRR